MRCASCVFAIQPSIIESRYTGFPRDKEKPTKRIENGLSLSLPAFLAKSCLIY